MCVSNKVKLDWGLFINDVLFLGGTPNEKNAFFHAQRLRDLHYGRKSNDFHIFMLYIMNFNIVNETISFSFQGLDIFQFTFTNINSVLVDIV